MFLNFEISVYNSCYHFFFCHDFICSFNERWRESCILLQRAWWQLILIFCASEVDFYCTMTTRIVRLKHMTFVRLPLMLLMRTYSWVQIGWDMASFNKERDCVCLYVCMFMCLYLHRLCGFMCITAVWLRVSEGWHLAKITSLNGHLKIANNQSKYYIELQWYGLSSHSFPGVTVEKSLCFLHKMCNAFIIIFMQEVSGMAVGIPGQLKGLAEIHRDYGRWTESCHQPGCTCLVKLYDAERW